jgi:hypothetical protein
MKASKETEETYDMYPLYWTPSRGVLLCGTRMSTKGNV